MHHDHHGPGDGAVDAVRDAAHGRTAHGIARAGLTARGTVYVLIGVIGVQIATGRRAEADQYGAITHLLRQPFGAALVALTAVGLGGYGIWRVSEAFFGVIGNDSTFARLQSAFRGGVYLFFCSTTVAVLFGSQNSQVRQQRGFTAEIMSHPGGRALILSIGVGTVLVSLWLTFEGLTRRFMRYFPDGLAPPVRRLIEITGVVGNTVRGIVFATAGVLLVIGAWEYEPAGASGIDGAVRAIQERGGVGALIVASLGLITFGAYGLLEARFRRV